jgi:predicted DNA-binding transcriptional regulator AlpA
MAQIELAPPLAVTIHEAVRLSGMSRTRIYELIKGRQLEAIKAGRRTLVSMPSLAAHLAALPRL